MSAWKRIAFVSLLAALLGSTPVRAQQITRDDASGMVTGLGSNLTPKAGETTCTMAPALAATVAADQPNGGLVAQQFSPTPCTAATVIVTPAPPTPTATPIPNVTISVGAAAGTGATFSVAAGSNLMRGAILVTAGTSPSVGTVLTITFPGGAPYVEIQMIGDNAVTVVPYLRTLSSTVASVGVRSAMTNGSVYTIGYRLTT